MFEYTTQILPDMLSLSPHICQCMRKFFVKRLRFLIATSNLPVKEDLVHLGRFMHFSQKVVGVTLKLIFTKPCDLKLIIWVIFFNLKLEAAHSLFPW